MVNVIDPSLQPQNVVVTSESGLLSGGRGTRARRPTAKVQAMRGKWNCPSCRLTADHSTEEHEQEKTIAERQTSAKAKKREVRVRKRDQAAKAAQQDPAQPMQARPGMAGIVPTAVDNAVCLSFIIYY